MKIAFDVQPLINNNKTGIAYCEEGIIDTFLNIYPDNKYFLDFFDYKSKLGTIDNISQMSEKGAIISNCNWFSGRLYRILWNFIPLKYSFFFKRKSQITHFFNYLIPPGVKGKRIATVHDMSFKAYPKTTRLKTKIILRLSLNKSCKRADKIMTISEFSKSEIVRYMGIPKSKIFVVPIGVNQDFFRPIEDKKAIEEIKSKYSVDGDYFLYLGTLEPRKNINRLIEAYYIISKEFVEAPSLVLAGGKGWNYDSIFDTVKKLKLEDKVIFTGYLDKSDIPYLLNGAVSFVFPSLYEGFGMPPLEAMSCGVPVITSNASSLPEVVGDAGILVDPFDINALYLAMKDIMTNSNLREELSKKGIERAKEFTWERSAEIIMNEYRRLLNDNNE